MALQLYDLLRTFPELQVVSKADLLPRTYTLYLFSFILLPHSLWLFLLLVIHTALISSVLQAGIVPSLHYFRPSFICNFTYVYIFIIVLCGIIHSTSLSESTSSTSQYLLRCNKYFPLKLTRVTSSLAQVSHISPPRLTRQYPAAGEAHHVTGESSDTWHSQDNAGRAPAAPPLSFSSRRKVEEAEVAQCHISFTLYVWRGLCLAWKVFVSN